MQMRQPLLVGRAHHHHHHHHQANCYELLARTGALCASTSLFFVTSLAAMNGLRRARNRASHHHFLAQEQYPVSLLPDSGQEKPQARNENLILRRFLKFALKAGNYVAS